MSNLIGISAVTRTREQRVPASLQPETFHAIVDNRLGQTVVYHPATMTFFECAPPATEAVRLWEEVHTRQTGLSSAQQDLAQRTLQALGAIVASKPRAKEDEEDINTKRLRRLAINVTQVCNLHCPMCYATDVSAEQTGTYGGDVRFVLPSVPEQSFKRMLEYYPEGIDYIQFHGGEPFLHPRGIKRACEGINAYCASLGVQPPAYTTISNGTCMTDEVLDIIEQYKILVTISLDGTKEVNDVNRPWALGKSTYDAATEGIKKLLERGLGPLTIECTISKPHLGTDLFALAKHFRALGATNIHMTPASVPKNHPHWLQPEDEKQMLAQWSHLFDMTMDSMGTPEPLYLGSILGRINTLSTHHREKHLCPAGTNTMAVDVTGNISACFMFTGMREFQLGRVQGKPRHEEFRQRQAKLMSTPLSQPLLCSGCWADGVCGDCSGGQMMTNMRGETSYPYSCLYDRLIIERVILGLARLQRDPKTWHQFKINFRGAPEDLAE